MEDKYTGNRKNSLKVNVSEVSSVENTLNGVPANGRESVQQREIYKKISEDSLLPPLNNTKVNFNSNSDTVEISAQSDKDAAEVVEKTEVGKMVHEENDIHDGADEQMLGLETKKLNEKRDEVKFINGDHQNGDAKIDIGVVNGKVFTGMTKEELMKYANDPFWVRLRWIFFIGFWAIWAGMLVGAILIIIDAPKCAAPEPLPWYKRGPLAHFASKSVGANDLAVTKKMQARGVIYELPPESTYLVTEPSVEQLIKEIVTTYKEAQIEVILDITPNYVPADSIFVKEALADSSKRSAFIWEEKPQLPNNWLSLADKPAWHEITTGNFVLSRFGDGLYDLRMDGEIVKEKFSEVLRHLLKLGVKGFRLKNSKYYLVDKDLKDEDANPLATSAVFTEYAFWTHHKTTFQESLGTLLYDYLSVVKNISTEAYFTIAEDIVRTDVYLIGNSSTFGIDTPLYGRFTKFLGAVANTTILRTELENTINNGNHTWLQWNYGDVVANSTIDSSAYALFMSLIPGTAVIPGNSAYFDSIDEESYTHLEQMRESPSFMYGDINFYQYQNLIGYSRIKSGNPGFLVVFNPYNNTQVGDFSGNNTLPHKLTVDLFSSNYKLDGVAKKSPAKSNLIQVAPLSTIIYTYVPVRAD